MINVLWASGKREKWYHELSEWQAIMSDMVSKTKKCTWKLLQGLSINIGKRKRIVIFKKFLVMWVSYAWLICVKKSFTAYDYFLNNLERENTGKVMDSQP